MSILIDRELARPGPGVHRERRHLSRPADDRVWDPGRRRRLSGKGRPHPSRAVRSFIPSPKPARATGADVSVLFVPPFAAADAIMEAAAAGIRLLVVITEGIPVLDMIRVKSFLAGHGPVFIGPNTPGIIVPGQAKAGIMPGPIHRPGRVGIMSRSGNADLRSRPADHGSGLGTIDGGRRRRRSRSPGLSFVDFLELFRTDPGNGSGRHDRRNRRNSRRRGRRRHPEWIPQARLRLYRRTDVAPGTTDGARRGHHRGRDGPGRGQSASPGRSRSRRHSPAVGHRSDRGRSIGDGKLIYTRSGGPNMQKFHSLAATSFSLRRPFVHDMSAPCVQTQTDSPGQTAALKPRRWRSGISAVPSTW